MTAKSAAQIIHFPATVIVTPTSVSTPGASGNYGGTFVGGVKEIGFQSVGEEAFEIWSECYGEVTDVLEGSNQFNIAMLLRGWDDDAVAQFMAGGYAAGSVSGHAVFTEPGARTPGQSTQEAANARNLKLLLLPDDPIHVPALMIYNAVPDWTPGATIALEQKSELGIPLTFRCMRNSAGNIYSWGMLADLSLT